MHSHIGLLSVFHSGEPFVELSMNKTDLAVVSTFAYNSDLLVFRRQTPALCVLYYLILFHT